MEQHAILGAEPIQLLRTVTGKFQKDRGLAFYFFHAKHLACKAIFFHLQESRRGDAFQGNGNRLTVHVCDFAHLKFFSPGLRHNLRDDRLTGHGHFRFQRFVFLAVPYGF